MGTARIEKLVLLEDALLQVTQSMKYVGVLKMENFLGDSDFKVDGMHIFDIELRLEDLDYLSKRCLRRPVLMWV